MLPRELLQSPKGLSMDTMGIIDSNKGKKRILPHCSQGDSD